MLDGSGHQWVDPGRSGYQVSPYMPLRPCWGEGIFVYREVICSVTNIFSAGKSPSTCILVRKSLVS